MVACDISRSLAQSVTRVVILPHLEDLHARESARQNHRQLIYEANSHATCTNRSYARLPDILETLWALPRVSSRSLHSSVVDESCHIGHFVVENAFESS